MTLVQKFKIAKLPGIVKHKQFRAIKMEVQTLSKIYNCEVAWQNPETAAEKIDEKNLPILIYI